MDLTLNDALKLGVKIFNEGKFENAKKIFLSILNVQPNNLEANNNLGLVFYKLKEYEKATNIFKRIIDLNPSYIIAYSNLGVSLQEQGKLNEAQIIYEKVIDLKPDFAQAHNNLGIIFEKIGNFEKAKLSIKEAIRINNKKSEFHYNLGNILLKLSKIDEAIFSYSKAIELTPYHKQALLNRGQIYFNKELFKLAFKDFNICDTKKSRPKVLSSLYALNKIKDIYDKIENYSKLDSSNLGVAAFASFIAYKEKKITKFNFCKNPLEFIKFSNLSYHFDDYKSFTNELIRNLKDIETTWEPQSKTTIKGYQSSDNLFDNPYDKLKDLKKVIIKEINLYREQFQNKNCTFINKWPSEENFSCWYVILKKQGHQNTHIHPNGWISGVLYLKIPPHLNKNEGAIEFSLNGENYSDKGSPNKIYQPKIGDIILFPSSLHHKTIPFSANTDRISIAFDLVGEINK